MLRIGTMGTAKKKRPPGLVGNQDAVQSKADRCFDLYLTMEPPRSLSLLHQRLSDVGLSISLSGLKYYSKRFNWQERLKTASQTAKANSAERDAKLMLTMAERHARTGETLQGLGLSDLKYQMNRDPGTRRSSPSDIAKLIDTGIRIERLARGEVTDRTELQVKAVSLIVGQVVDVFADIATRYSINPKAITEFAAGAERITADALMQSEQEAEFVPR